MAEKRFLKRQEFLDIYKDYEEQIAQIHTTAELKTFLEGKVPALNLR